MKLAILAAVAAVSVPCVASAQTMSDDTSTPVAPVATQQIVPVSVSSTGAVTLPANTVIVVTPLEEITSKKMKEGTTRTLQVANDITESGRVIIPRGSPVEALVTWRTGKGIGGKSAKFELTFQKVTVGSKTYALKGKHRQEGRGNTVAALLGSMLISGRSAVMTSGQMVNAFTAEPITVE